MYGILSGWAVAPGQPVIFDNFWMGIAAKVVAGF
jgi:hypothetical protein